mmetsp:Transcript_27749/g.74683  ORF Transcript_27749/g.74683 Transcript_27749/m.74683 type:complete len:110 (+) Transcript_27749:823-1152(+)
MPRGKPRRRRLRHIDEEGIGRGEIAVLFLIDLATHLSNDREFERSPAAAARATSPLPFSAAVSTRSSISASRSTSHLPATSVSRPGARSALPNGSAVPPSRCSRRQYPQ